MTYYDRTSGVAEDGTPTFATLTDLRSEAHVAVLLERAWACDLHRFGALAPLDWFATRHGRLASVLELKTRSHPSDRYGTVFLNLRKWLALNLASVGLGIPAIFVVRFTDAVLWVPVGAGGWPVRIGGCRQTVKSRSDVEPVLEVPVDQMTAIQDESE